MEGRIIVSCRGRAKWGGVPGVVVFSFLSCTSYAGLYFVMNYLGSVQFPDHVFILQEKEDRRRMCRNHHGMKPSGQALAPRVYSQARRPRDSRGFSVSLASPATLQDASQASRGLPLLRALLFALLLISQVTSSMIHWNFLFCEF